MTASLVATFDRQQQAAAAAERLVAAGLARDRLFLRADERGMGPPASSPTPTTVVRDTLDPAAVPSPERRSHGARADETVRAPALQDRMSLYVALPCGMAEDELLGLLQSAGAAQVERSDEAAPRPNPAAQPTLGAVDPDDAARARAAASGGEGLPPTTKG